LLPRHSERAAKGVCMKNLPANLRKLLEWLDRISPLPEAQIVAAGLDHTLDKALMQNFAEMNLCEATVSITARGRDALSKFPVVRPRISEDNLPTGPSGQYPDGRRYVAAEVLRRFVRSWPEPVRT
jgi:hypothetical protein